jgi:hypothetical protein
MPVATKAKFTAAQQKELAEAGYRRFKKGEDSIEAVTLFRKNAPSYTSGKSSMIGLRHGDAKLLQW